MLQYEETLSEFFGSNNIEKGTTYVKILELTRTKDLADVSDDDLRHLWLTSDDFLELWTCKVFVQLHLASWKWQTVIDLLVQYRDELRNDTRNTTNETVFEDILRKIGFDRQNPPRKRATIRDVQTCELVLDSLKEMMQLLNQHKMSVSPPSWKLLDFLVQYKDMLGITEQDAASVVDKLEMEDTAHVNMLLWLKEQDVLGLSLLNEAQQHQLWALIKEYQRDHSYRKFVIPPLVVGGGGSFPAKADMSALLRELQMLT